MKKRTNKKIKEIILSMPFFIVMTYMMILGFIWPLRPTVSVSEKRTLAEFPEFSLSALLSGQYAADISYWFADTFPGRESWLNIARVEESLHGFTYNYIDVSHIKQSDEVPVTQIAESPAPAAAVTPRPVSTPVITDSPVPSLAVPSPAPAEFTMQTQATEFTEIDPEHADIEIYSGAFKINDTVYAFQGFDKTASDKYLGYLNSFAETAERRGYNFYNVIAPTSLGIVLPDSIRDKLGCADQREVLDYIFSNTYKSVRNVNTYDIIKEHSEEYVYYHSDHHWTGLGAYYAYMAFCEEAGIIPVSLDDYTSLDQGEFLGSFAATAALSGNVKKDRVTAYAPPGNINMSYLMAGGQEVKADVIKDMSNEEPSNKYNAFIGGDRRLTVLTNENIRTGPDCLVIKDSFGNPFSVYLTEHYRHVYVVDYRKLDESVLDLAEQFGTADIILCQSIGVSQSKSANGLLGQILK